METKAGDRFDSTALLRWLGLVLATFDALCIASAHFANPIGALPRPGLIWASAVLLGFCFLWMLFDPGVRYAVDAANKEIKGGDSDADIFRWRHIRLLDPTWGLFGSRVGGIFLCTLRVVLFGELFVEGIFFGGHNVQTTIGTGIAFSGHGMPAPGLLLSFLGAMLTVLLGIVGLKTHYPRTITTSLA